MAELLEESDSEHAIDVQELDAKVYENEGQEILLARESSDESESGSGVIFSEADVQWSDEIVWPKDAPTDKMEEMPEYFKKLYYQPIHIGRSMLELAVVAVSKENEKLSLMNRHYQVKLADYFAKKKTVPTEFKEIAPIVNQHDYEVKFMKDLVYWYEYLHKMREEEDESRVTIVQLHNAFQEAYANTELSIQTFHEEKAEAMKTAAHSQTGQKISVELVDQLLHKEKLKLNLAREARLDNIFLRWKVRKREAALKLSDEMTGGHHMYDFEQLKVENQTYNEKIEERNEERTKLQKKMMNTIHIMAHMKEKGNFLMSENEKLRVKLNILDVQVAKKRENLTGIRLVKEQLEAERHMLQQRSGLLGKNSLLHDFKLKQEQAIVFKNHLVDLKMAHHDDSSEASHIRELMEQMALKDV